MFCFSLKIFILLITISSLSIFVNANAITNTTENFQEIRMKRQSINGFEFVNCVLPPHPENGQWSVISGEGTPGSTILPNTLITFKCNQGFELVPKTQYFLCDTDWDPEKMPRCEEKFCPPLTSTSTTSLKCYDGTGEQISCQRAFHGNTATVKCAEYHEIPKGKEGSIQCFNQKWSQPLPVCEPVCGTEVNKNELGSLLDNRKEKVPKYPWVITLFQKRDTGNIYICSGTLLSAAYILTAAHCVSEFDGKVKEANNYQIAAGKTYTSYGDPRDLMAQYVNVDTIIVHPNFRGGVSNYVGDIALLKTKRPLRLSPLVQPICFKGLNNIILEDNAEGVVSLWGLQNDYKLTEEVRDYKIKRDDKKCKNSLSDHFSEVYYTEEKVCAFFEKSDEPLCKGYSGAGWMFKNPQDNRYYIHGIVSVAETDKITNCAVAATLCTKTSSYYDFVIAKMSAV